MNCANVPRSEHYSSVQQLFIKLACISVLYRHVFPCIEGRHGGQSCARLVSQLLLYRSSTTPCLAIQFTTLQTTHLVGSLVSD